jgi:hypothetical protein
VLEGSVVVNTHVLLLHGETSKTSIISNKEINYAFVFKGSEMGYTQIENIGCHLCLCFCEFMFIDCFRFFLVDAFLSLCLLGFLLQNSQMEGASFFLLSDSALLHMNDVNIDPSPELGMLCTEKVLF